MWSKDGFDRHLWVDTPGKSWLEYTHAVDERIVVQRGRVEFEINGERTTRSSGDQITVPAGIAHSVWNRGASYWFYGFRRLEESGY